MKQNLFRLSPLLMLVSPVAYAHSGHEGSSFFMGVSHPLTGLDHLLALLLIGVLLGLGKLGLARVALPAIASALLGGAVFGMLGGAQAWVEWLIILSLPALIVMLWAAPRISSRHLLVVVAGLVMAHAWVHGVEAGQQATYFITGFFLVSLALILTTAAMVKRLVEQSGISVVSNDQ